MNEQTNNELITNEQNTCRSRGCVVEAPKVDEGRVALLAVPAIVKRCPVRLRPVIVIMEEISEAGIIASSRRSVSRSGHADVPLHNEHQRERIRHRGVGE